MHGGKSPRKLLGLGTRVVLTGARLIQIIARAATPSKGVKKTFITAVFRWLGEQVEQDFRVIPAAPCRLLLVPTRIFIRNGLSGAYPTRSLSRPFFTFSLLFFHFFFFFKRGFALR